MITCHHHLFAKLVHLPLGTTASSVMASGLGAFTFVTDLAVSIASVAFLGCSKC